MSDLQSLPENHYCVPYQTNFPRIDSFAAVEIFILRSKEQRTVPCWFSNDHWRKEALESSRWS